MTGAHQRPKNHLRRKFAAAALGAMLLLSAAPFVALAQQTDQYGNDMSQKYAGQDYNQSQAQTTYSKALGEMCGTSGVGYSCNSNTKYFKCQPKTDDLPTCQDISPAKQQPERPAPKQIVPTLSIPIPTLNFSDAMLATQDGEAGLKINWIGQYIQAVYRFGIGIATVLAAVMMMIGGVQWLTAGGDAGRVTAAKEKISDATMGLALSLGIFTILQLVNPDMLNLNTIFIKQIQPIELYNDPVSDTPIGAVATDFLSPAGGNITGPGRGQVPKELTPDIEAAAKELAATDAGGGQTYGIMIGSSFRTPEKQKQLIAENCENPPGSATCKPKQGRPYTCTMQGNPPDPKNCPHTTGHALDLWGMKCKGGKCTRCIESQSVCTKDAQGMANCVADPCQQALIKAMGNVGFCRWQGEAWHFEKPAMSKNCVIGK